MKHQLILGLACLFGVFGARVGYAKGFNTKDGIVIGPEIKLIDITSEDIDFLDQVPYQGTILSLSIGYEWHVSEEFSVTPALVYGASVAQDQVSYWSQVMIQTDVNRMLQLGLDLKFSEPRLYPMFFFVTPEFVSYEFEMRLNHVLRVANFVDGFAYDIGVGFQMSDNAELRLSYQDASLKGDIEGYPFHLNSSAFNLGVGFQF
ncbi:MAG: outer membrane beta-barrel protein [Shewanellaceae bacterium]|nr:outer membrane beta-barrel protein [Shewanellaceae bacterium]